MKKLLATITLLTSICASASDLSSEFGKVINRKTNDEIYIQKQDEKLQIILRKQSEQVILKEVLIDKQLDLRSGDRELDFANSANQGAQSFLSSLFTDIPKTLIEVCSEKSIDARVVCIVTVPIMGAFQIVVIPLGLIGVGFVEVLGLTSIPFELFYDHMSISNRSQRKFSKMANGKVVHVSNHVFEKMILKIQNEL